MENLTIEASKYTPSVNFSQDNHVLSIEGKSTPENTFEFFEPIMSWLKEYFSTNQTAKIEFNIPYFNSSSSRVIYDFFDLLEKAQIDGSSLTVYWKYAAENENALESGEEFQEDFESLGIQLLEL